PSRRPSPRYEYVCRECGILYRRQRKVNTNRYVCGRCGGKLVLYKMYAERGRK
ncbi:zinc ribbon domain-containing protein, partial [Heyndrickxia coagulans]|nr:zinc ribbon domain-containing protein [Heyndrickxia coagulans]